jgi:hypothetical protein
MTYQSTADSELRQDFEPQPDLVFEYSSVTLDEVDGRLIIYTLGAKKLSAIYQTEGEFGAFAVAKNIEPFETYDWSKVASTAPGMKSASRKVRVIALAEGERDGVWGVEASFEAEPCFTASLIREYADFSTGFSGLSGQYQVLQASSGEQDILACGDGKADITLTSSADGWVMGRVADLRGGVSPLFPDFPVNALQPFIPTGSEQPMSREYALCLMQHQDYGLKFFQASNTEITMSGLITLNVNSNLREVFDTNWTNGAATKAFNLLWTGKTRVFAEIFVVDIEGKLHWISQIDGGYTDMEPPTFSSWHEPELFVDVGHIEDVFSVVTGPHNFSIFLPNADGELWYISYERDGKSWRNDAPPMNIAGSIPLQNNFASMVMENGDIIVVGKTPEIKDKRLLIFRGTKQGWETYEFKEEA